MTPDSLEPLQLMQMKRKTEITSEHDRSVGTDFTLKVGQPDRDVLCATVGSQLSELEANGGGIKTSDVFLDSLEPFSESATAF